MRLKGLLPGCQPEKSCELVLRMAAPTRQKALRQLRSNASRGEGFSEHVHAARCPLGVVVALEPNFSSVPRYCR